MADVNPLSKEWEKCGLVLRDYQKEGVEIMDSWYQAGHGGINGDEMGLGKTCQAIVEMLRLKADGKGPFLVVCPLSVADHWVSEVTRFSCETLTPIPYFGFEEARQDVMKKLGKLKKNMVFIVPYHILRRDAELINKLQVKSKLSFDVIVVDEAHSIKNSESQIAETLKPYKRDGWFLLMTGTPIQNHLGELYSLLTFVDSKQFKDNITSKKYFMDKYKDDANLPELKKILSKYLIRRTKDVVCKELPACDQVVIYHNITDLQKRLYLDIIARDREALLSVTERDTISLTNLHMQLRKCVSHPYLFKGVEPQPFVEGEHIVEASGKFQVFDRLLRYLKEKKHKCLVFSQFVIVLDIIQDFLNLRGYNYERLDGSVRAEERFEAINNFQRTSKRSKKEAEDDGPWCFLLSTKAGGVGLNLSAADTVIFLDADWNPQNDIQAMARCHRIGQSKPVRVIRLIGRYTIEQHMHARIREKVKFTDKVMGNDITKLTAVDLLAMIKQSLGTLKEQTYKKYELSDKELESVIGETNAKGEWLPLTEKENQVADVLRLDPDEVDKRDTDYNDYLVFEGHRYRVSAKDEAAFKELQNKTEEKRRQGRRRRFGEDENASDLDEDNKKLSDLAISEKRKKAALAKRDAMWKANDYASANLSLPSADDQRSVESEVEEVAPLHFVYGDVTRPQRAGDDRSTYQLIVHCVDNSGGQGQARGTFGSRGIFGALRAKDPAVADRYELISRMGDMHMGDAHLISDIRELRDKADDNDEPSEPSTSADLKEAVVLCVVQSKKRRGEIRPAILEECLIRIGEYARQNDASVHMARIGYGTSLSWYNVERLIKQHISNLGVPTYIYYFARPQRQPSSPSPPAQTPSAKKRANLSPAGPSKRAKMEPDSGDDTINDEDMEVEEKTSPVEEKQPTTSKRKTRSSDLAKRDPADVHIQEEDKDDQEEGDKDDQEEKLTPTKKLKPSPRKLRKRTKPKKDLGVVPVDDIEDEEESSDSEPASSESEHDWSEEDEEVEDEEEEMSEDDVSSSEEEVEEDEEPDELEDTPKPRRPQRTISKITSKKASAAQSSERNEDNPKSGYRTPDNAALFTNVAISLYGLDKDTIEKLSDIIVEEEGYPITEENELKDATHAVINAEMAADTRKFEEFRDRFDLNCDFVKESWITDSINAGKKLDPVFYEL